MKWDGLLTRLKRIKRISFFNSELSCWAGRIRRPVTGAIVLRRREATFYRLKCQNVARR
jgi:hypothetical protein